MEPKEIILKITNDKIYFNQQLFISIGQTNIPRKFLLFKTQKDIFWIVKMLSYEPNNKSLKVQVIDYNANSIFNFDNQKPKKEVKQLLFEKFEWNKIEQNLSYYQISELHDIIQYTTLSNSAYTKASSHSTTPFEQKLKNINDDGDTILINNQSLVSSTAPEQGPICKTLKKEFGIPFTDLHFKLGYVTFNKYINEIKKSLDIKILNEHILAEFENVKFWFAKKLKTKRIRVIAIITLIDDQITDVTAKSIHIDRITPELIDSIKYQRTIALTKEPRINTQDKSIFTSDEIFNQFDSNDIIGNVFNQTEDGIFDLITEKSNVRNKKQLAYLASKKQSDKYKLRYTLHPHFGFLFLIEGFENNHFVWELLKTNATYIWSINKSNTEIEFQFKRIESSISTIRSVGREAYKKAYRNKNLDNDIVFRIVEHDEIGSDPNEGFPKWKNKLNEQLT